MRKKEESSKQGQTNNKAKQHSTPNTFTRASAMHSQVNGSVCMLTAFASFLADSGAKCKTMDFWVRRRLLLSTY